jgi:hypothetical protein
MCGFGWAGTSGLGERPRQGEGEGPYRMRGFMGGVHQISLGAGKHRKTKSGGEVPAPAPGCGVMSGVEAVAGMVKETGKGKGKDVA